MMAREHSVEPSAVADAVPTVPKQIDRTVTDLAKDCIVLCGNNMDRAAEMFVRRLHQEMPEVRKALQSQLWTLYAQERCRAARTRIRDDIAAARYVPPSPDQQQVNRAAARAAVSSWFDWPLGPTGVLMGAAKRADLEAASKQYLDNARASKAAGDWLDALARALPDEKTTVSKALTETQIAAMAAQFGVRGTRGA